MKKIFASAALLFLAVSARALEMPVSTWTQWKSICLTQKNLDCQYVDYGDFYYIVGPDGNSINWTIQISKLNPDGSTNPDSTDFENVAKSSCNASIGVRLQMASQGYSFSFTGSLDGTTPTVSTGYLHWTFNGYVLNGMNAWTVGSIDGDIYTLDVVDKDNLLGKPGFDPNNPTVLTIPPLLTNWNVDAQDHTTHSFTAPYTMKPPYGMYLRIRYTTTKSSLLTPPTLYLNVFIYKPI